MKELEVRILDINLDSLREKINNMGAVKVKQENQTNHIYDFSDRKLLNNKGYARIRIVKDLLNNKEFNYITVKKLLSQDKYKIMDEHETQIDDSTEGCLIFEALGLTLVETIKKYRESYKYKETLIEIDINDKNFCPFPYIELETSDENQLEEVVSLLGYTMEDTTSQTIYEILKHKGIIKGL